MSDQILAEVAKDSLKNRIPALKVGDVVKVHQRIKEGEKERIQVFQGLIIKISSGSGIRKTFTVRKVVQGIGVEKIFPFHSPDVKKIEVLKRSRVRRAKLYYMRERFGKSARIKEIIMSPEEKAELIRNQEDGPDEVVQEVEKTEEKTEQVETPEVVEKTEEPKKEEASVEEKKEETPAEEKKED